MVNSSGGYFLHRNLLREERCLQDDGGRTLAEGLDTLVKLDLRKVDQETLEGDVSLHLFNFKLEAEPRVLALHPFLGQCLSVGCEAIAVLSLGNHVSPLALLRRQRGTKRELGTPRRTWSRIKRRTDQVLNLLAEPLPLLILLL